MSDDGKWKHECVVELEPTFHLHFNLIHNVAVEVLKLDGFETFNLKV